MKKAFLVLDENKDGFLGPLDVKRLCKRLGVRLTLNGIKDMIWEIDSDGDGFLDYGDLLDAFRRHRADVTCSEPKQLLDMIEFLMYDLRMTGSITTEEAMLIVSRRFRQNCSEADIRKFFIVSRVDPKQAISFEEFKEQLNYRRMLYEVQ